MGIYRGTGSTAAGAAYDHVDSADLASTATDDGTLGFHLVHYPPLSGETGVTDYEYPVGDVRRYGAVGDGVTDDTAAIQAALAVATNTGKEVLLTGAHVITGVLTVEGCTLKGSGVFSRGDYTTAGFLLITDTVNEAIRLKTTKVLDGVNFYYPNQVTTLTPTVYPATVFFHDGTGLDQTLFTNIKNCTFVNSYIAIDTNGDIAIPSSTGSNRIYNNNICAIFAGIIHRYSLNEMHVYGNIASYSLWDESVGQDIRKTINNSCDFIQIYDSDGITILDNLVFGYGSAVAFKSTAVFTTISANLIDGCYRCIDLSDATTVGEVLISDNTIFAKDARATVAPTDCAGLYGLWTTGTLSGFINSSGNIYGNADGNHINLDVSGTATANIRLKTDDTFFSAGRNDAAVAHYSVYVTDSSNQVTLDIDGVFEDTVNPGSNVSTGVYIDGCASANIDVTVKGYETGLEITSSNANGRYHIKGYTGKTTTTDIVDGTSIGQTIYGTIYPDVTKTVLGTVASATTITLPQSSIKYIAVSGTTAITSVTASWYGREIILKFNGVLTFTDGLNLKLAGNMSTTADDTILLICDGTDWYETGRSVN